MKSERRHELQQNDLASRIVVWTANIKPYVSWIVGGVIVGILIALIISFQRGESEAERLAMWDEYYSAEATRDLEKLKELAAKHAGKPLGEIATLTMADTFLAQGAGQAQINKSEAQKSFGEAVSSYISVVESADDPMLKNRALFGHAQALEWMMQLDKAKAVYERVEGPLKLQADRSVARLNEPATPEFYEMFASFTPRPAFDPTQLPPNFELSDENSGDFDLLDPSKLDPFGSNQDGDSDRPFDGLLNPLDAVDPNALDANGEGEDASPPTDDLPADDGELPSEDVPPAEPAIEETPTDESSAETESGEEAAAPEPTNEVESEAEETEVDESTSEQVD